MPRRLDDFIAPPEPLKKGEKPKPKPKHILEGDMEVMPDCHYQSGQQYNLRGLGPIFSGPYGVKRAVHTIDSSGYSVRLTMQRHLSGGSSGSKSNPSTSTKSEEPRRDPAPKDNPPKIEYHVNKASGSVRVTGIDPRITP